MNDAMERANKPISSVSSTLKKGWKGLINVLSASKEKGLRTIVVTISRRMPRILSWLSDQASEEERNIFRSCEITTEIALPFIELGSSEKCHVIVADDVVVTGKTLTSVCALVRHYLNIAPTIYVFYIEKGILPKLTLEIGSKIHSSSEFTKANGTILSRHISRIIAEELPIDLAFPVIRILEDPLTIELFRIGDYFSLQRIGKDLYEINVSNPDSWTSEGKSISVLLPNELDGNLNNDFAKIRYFFKRKEIRAVPYAPNILSTDELTDSKLFENPVYAQVWLLIQIHTSMKNAYVGNKDDAEMLRIRTMRSLATVANYMYSLSTFNRNFAGRKMGLSDKVMFLDAYDLDLLVGRNLRQLIFPYLSIILEDGLVSPRLHRRVSLDSTYIPEQLKSTYKVDKYQRLLESDFEYPLETVFQEASSFSKRYKNGAGGPEYDVEGVMESYESLEDAMKGAYAFDKLKLRLNKWIDTMIDEGKVVARYANVYDGLGREYWRRFFRYSSMQAMSLTD